MPSLLRIIRPNGDNGEKLGWYALSLRSDFFFETASMQIYRSEPDTGRKERQEEIVEQAGEQARAIIEQANAQAAALIANARRQAEAEAGEIKDAAARKGYEEGRRAAQEVLAKAGEEADAIRAKARQVLNLAEEARREKLEQLKDEILALAVEIAEKIVGVELKTRPEAVLDIAGEAIMLAVNREQLVLWVNPAEMEICRARRDSLAALLPPRAQLQIMADESIEPGGCVVESEYGKVDARLSSRWRSLLASLREGAGNPDAGKSAD